MCSWKLDGQSLLMLWDQSSQLDLLTLLTRHCLHTVFSLSYCFLDYAAIKHPVQNITPLQGHFLFLSPSNTCRSRSPSPPSCFDISTSQHKLIQEFTLTWRGEKIWISENNLDILQTEGGLCCSAYLQGAVGVTDVNMRLLKMLTNQSLKENFYFYSICFIR